MDSVLTVLQSASGSEDRSLEFRIAVSGCAVDTKETFTQVLKASLELPEPSRSPAVVGVLQDVLESKISAVQETLFGAVEDSVGDLTSLVQQSDAKHRNALLSCVVDLCRGASALFRARLLRFLSAVMPPLDKSGLNMRGVVSSPSFKPAEVGASDVQSHEKFDYVLYNSFYKLQHFMGQMVAPTKQFDSFVQCIDVVLKAIESCPPVAVAPAAPSDPPLSVAYFRDPEVFLAQFTPEFDSNGQFKLQILTQLAIYLNYLETQPSKSNMLMEKEMAWVKEMQVKVLGEITRLSGSVSWLEEILRHDSMWWKWRGDGAKVDVLLETGPVAAVEKNEDGDGAEASSKQQSTQPGGVSKRRVPTGLGNAELTRLWSLGSKDKLGEGGSAQVTIPTYQSFLDRVKEECDPENGIEEAYRVTNTPLFEWKTLRAVLEQKASLLNFSGMFKDKLELATLALHASQPSTKPLEEEGAPAQSGAEGEKIDKSDNSSNNNNNDKNIQDGDLPIGDGDDVLEGADSQSVAMSKRSRDDGDDSINEPEKKIKGDGDDDAAAAAPEEQPAVQEQQDQEKMDEDIVN